MKNVLTFLIVFAVFSLAGDPAYAYLDPGTGSMILSTILGGIAGLIVVGKLYWHKLRTGFSRLIGGADVGEMRTTDDDNSTP